MVQFQDSIFEHLHHHTFFNMLFDGIFEAHHVQILSYYNLGVDVWFTIQLIFLAFQLTSPVTDTPLSIPPWSYCDRHPIINSSL
jgi:hypothetical protein